ncbi:MAG: hypothetical protein Q9227_002769 [Pyrenula ochraceoflavens]
MAAAFPIAAAGAAADPRLSKEVDRLGNYPTRVQNKLHDPSIQIEEYMHFAKISRADEDNMYGPSSEYGKTKGPLQLFVLGGMGRKPPQDARRSSVASNVFTVDKKPDEKAVGDEKVRSASSDNESPAPVVSDEEWVRASRAARTATWGAIFYLITTDILGPYTAPWAFSQLGYGPGVVLYTVFGVFAWYSGWQIYKMFLQLDSDRYPLKGYGDIAFRVFGAWARHVVNVLQSFQFFLNVALIIIGSGMSISQMSKEKLCFIICVLVSMLAGWLIGQIRTLQRLGWVANLAIWLNVTVLIITMATVANGPNYTAVAASSPQLLPDPSNPAPIQKTGGSPAGLTFDDNVNGLMQAVFSYGGATLFTELLSEMKRPFDFWKALLCADLFIYCVYLLFALEVYSFQGQYTFQSASQGIAAYGPQTACNALSLISGLIAACLYGNIGIKVLYNNVGRELFKWPQLETTKGKWIWFIFVPIYWGLAFIIAMAVPQITNFSAFVAALCILQFTYTFPPLIMVGFKSQRDAILPEESFDPNTGVVNRVDSGFKRWSRGFRKEFMWNAFDCFYFLGSLTTGVLGLYSSIKAMNHAYTTNPNLSGFTCKSPTG